MTRHEPILRTVLAVGALCLVIFLAADPAMAIRFRDRLHSSIEKGNDRYSEEENESALDSYMRAQREDSTHAVPYFNAGDAFYRMGKYDE
ncbi:MAG: hypothetical protein PVJ42_11280, partial [bacterium]